MCMLFQVQLLPVQADILGAHPSFIIISFFTIPNTNYTLWNRNPLGYSLFNIHEIQI